jgi:hypothetical protein
MGEGYLQAVLISDGKLQTDVRPTQALAHP